MFSGRCHKYFRRQISQVFETLASCISHTSSFIIKLLIDANILYIIVVKQTKKEVHPFRISYYQHLRL
jgi:predicted nucleic acid-binding protein